MALADATPERAGVTLWQFARACEELSRTEFLEKHRAPFLVQLTSPVAREESSTGLMIKTLEVPSSRRLSTDDLRVFELEKRSRNPFADMITVGRAANNDVVLPSACVSKFHAFFREMPHEWVLVDAESMNGTFLEGQRLAPAQVARLDLDRSPIAVSFGTVDGELVSPSAFWESLRSFLRCGTLAPSA